MHIVYSLVTQVLEGSIDCESSPGVGTRFLIRFAGDVLKQRA
jgi:signal transduction histidine kinase